VLRFISRMGISLSLSVETAMLLKRTKALSSEIPFRIEVTDGAVALWLGFSNYRTICLRITYLLRVAG
jgi:hypothetical protein